MGKHKHSKSKRSLNGKCQNCKAVSSQDEKSDTNESDIISYQQNPLLNSVIVRQISNCLKFESLKNFRSVCTLWQRESFKHFENSCKVALQFNEIHKSVYDFTKTFGTAFEKKRVYRSIQIWTPGHLETELLSTWFKKYGTKLDRLHLGRQPNADGHHATVDQSICTLTATHLCKILLEWCYNLKHLVIPVTNFVREKTLGDFDTYKKRMKGVKPKFVSLESLEIGCKLLVSYTKSNEIQQLAVWVGYFVKQIESIKLYALGKDQSFMFWKLNPKTIKANLVTKLDLTYYNTNSKSFEQLLTLDFCNLMELKLGNYEARINETYQSLNDFLVSVGPKLELLMLQYVPVEGITIIPLTLHKVEVQSLSHLKKLNVHLQHWDVGTAQDIARRLPHLQKLDIISQPENLKNFVGTSAEIHSKSQLEILNITWTVTVAMVGVLSKLFPNVKKLQCGTGSYYIMDHLQQFSKLQKLSITMLDFPIFEFSTHMHQCENLEEVHFKVVDEPGNGKEKFPHNLKLKFGSNDLYKSFLALPSLKYLEMVGVELSEEAYLMLKEKGNQVKVRLTSCIIKTSGNIF